ncbi:MULTISPECIES: YdcH family protein [unclassified Campylobacter]|uniref:YdcH family protein n=1 Tax=unclassified Campylobacter TaxID=2593542 RepID=UPI0022E9B19F|nr:MULTISPECIES: YdcH family protein [unclassified Campylobacter]MDA3048666.1 YdcH family protein [Campylobacter sp. JMF_08 NE1]MDA3077959.1 YdcH family protein [Campylobacter sp. JMF_06 NA1]
MFHEYRDLITELKGKNARFDALFEKHDELDHQIAAAVEGRVHMSDLEVDSLKREKLRVKDEIGMFLAKIKAEKEGK